MQVSLDTDIHSYTIRAYQAGEVSLMTPYIEQQNDGNDVTPPKSPQITTILGSFILSPQHLIKNWPAESSEQLEAVHLEAIIALKPELVLLGTGPRLTFPSQQILMGLHEQRIGVEIMDTAAACRTFNILVSEGRFVVAGLMNPAVEN
jgi:uncharacterized protein